MAGYGSVQKQFDVATEVLNKNPRFRPTLKTRAVQEQFNNLLKEFRKEDAKDSAMSGVETEMTPLQHMISSVVTAVDEIQAAEKKEKDETTKAEARKAEAARRVLGQASAGSRTGDSKSVDEDGAEDFPLRGLKRRRLAFSAPPRMEDGMAFFGTSMRDTELAKVELENKRLELDRTRHGDMLRECAAERKQHAEDRDAKERADMKRLKAMLDFAVSSIKTATQGKNQ